MISRAKVEEQRNKLREHSFGSWQIINTIRQIFNEKPMDFTEYLGTIGLLTKEDRVQLAQFKQMQEAQRKQEAKAAAAQADKILDLDKERFNRPKRRK